jgi:hypothetical protein
LGGVSEDVDLLWCEYADEVYGGGFSEVVGGGFTYEELIRKVDNLVVGTFVFEVVPGPGELELV